MNNERNAMSFADHFTLADDIIYLNHAAVAPWPRVTMAAVHTFAEQNARFGSRHYPDWIRTEQALREQLRTLINARSSDEIALLKSTSEGLSVVAHGLDWEPGDNVIITNQEFPSNRIVWESLIPGGVEVRYADISRDDPEAAILALIDARTKLVSVSSVQYGNGLRLNLETIGRACEQREVLFCIDAIQSLGALPFDVRAVRADFVVADGHKWLLGPEGLALFYCRKEIMPRVRLHQFGWHMVDAMGDYDRKDWSPASTARRFECGSPNMLGIHALHASLELILSIGMDTIAQSLQANTQLILDTLQQSGRFTLLSPQAPERRAGIVTFKPQQGDVADLFERLQNAGVQCALRAGGIRFSPHFYMPRRDIERVLSYIV